MQSGSSLAFTPYTLTHTHSQICLDAEDSTSKISPGALLYCQLQTGCLVTDLTSRALSTVTNPIIKTTEFLFRCFNYGVYDRCEKCGWCFINSQVGSLNLKTTSSSSEKSHQLNTAQRMLWNRNRATQGCLAGPAVFGTGAG